jgi:dienelactone hydrolase
VLARGVYGAAALLYVVALLGLRQATGDVAHYAVTLPGAVPAVIYEPGEPSRFGPPERDDEDAGLPVVVLAHGFSANKGAMSSLARRLARGGYGVIALDFRGHGENPRPFERSFAGTPEDGLAQDLDRAVLYARTSARFDGQRIAVVGHSMGGGVALAYASREPKLAATVAISAGWGADGPYTPPNVLLIWSSNDPVALRDGARATGARLAGLEQLVLDRTYGEAARGTAVRLSEVGGDHLFILYSGEAADRILTWLRGALGPGDPPSGSGDGRIAWALLALLTWGVLFWGLPALLAPILPRAELPPGESAPSGSGGSFARVGPFARLGLLVASLGVAALLLSATDPASDRGPASFIPLLVARDLVALLGLAGVLLCVWLALGRRISLGGLREPRTWVAALLMAGFGYVGLHSALSPFVDAWLSPWRLVPALLCAVALLPFFGALEWLLRGSGRTGVWLPIAGRVLVLLALAAAALFGLVSFVVLLGLAGFALLFAVLELGAQRLWRASPSPWTLALFQSIWLGVAFAASFPLTD